VLVSLAWIVSRRWLVEVTLIRLLPVELRFTMLPVLAILSPVSRVIISFLIAVLHTPAGVANVLGRPIALHPVVAIVIALSSVVTSASASSASAPMVASVFTAEVTALALIRVGTMFVAVAVATTAERHLVVPRWHA